MIRQQHEARLFNLNLAMLSVMEVLARKPRTAEGCTPCDSNDPTGHVSDST